MLFSGALAPLTWEATAAGLVLGLLVGSFLNVVILRLPRMMEEEERAYIAQLQGQPLPASAPFNLIRPGSHCPACRRALRPWHNIPLLSWLALRGRCAFCGAGISARYPAVELLTGVLSALVARTFGLDALGLSALVFTWVLVALAGIDTDTMLLPDSLTQPLLWAGLALNLRGLWTPLPDAVIGAMAGYLVLWVIYWGFRLFTGKEGMGAGDFKLLAALGAWLGWQALLPIILLSSVCGAAFGLIQILRRRAGAGQPLPFGPYLAAAGWLTLYAGYGWMNAVMP